MCYCCWCFVAGMELYRIEWNEMKKKKVTLRMLIIVVRYISLQIQSKQPNNIMMEQVSSKQLKSRCSIWWWKCLLDTSRLDGWNDPVCVCVLCFCVRVYISSYCTFTWWFEGFHYDEIGLAEYWIAHGRITANIKKIERIIAAHNENKHHAQVQHCIHTQTQTKPQKDTDFVKY